MSTVRVGALWIMAKYKSFIWEIVDIKGPDVYLRVWAPGKEVDTFFLEAYIATTKRLQIQDLQRTMRPVTKLEQLLKGIESES